MRAVQVQIGTEMPVLVAKVNGSVTRHALRGVAVIGRDKTCDIVLAGDKLSSRHNTKVFTDGRRFLVQDLESRNGTYLNGVRVRETQGLQHGDELKVGSAVIIFEEDVAPRPRPAPRPNAAVDSASDDAARAFLKFFYALLLILIFGVTAVLSKLLFVMMLSGS